VEVFKLALAASLGMPLTKRKRVHGLGIVLADTHTQGLFYGRDFTHLDPLPLMRNEKIVDQNAVLADAEDGSMQFAGEWSTDSRICLEARAPRPCTACAIVADTESMSSVEIRQPPQNCCASSTGRTCRRAPCVRSVCVDEGGKVLGRGPAITLTVCAQSCSQTPRLKRAPTSV